MKASIISKVLEEPIEGISKFDEPNIFTCRPLSAEAKNFSVIYKTADTRIS